jgi:hypothetical protein
MICDFASGKPCEVIASGGIAAERNLRCRFLRGAPSPFVYGTDTGPSRRANRYSTVFALVRGEPMTGIEPAYSAWEADSAPPLPSKPDRDEGWGYPLDQTHPALNGPSTGSLCRNLRPCVYTASAIRAVRVRVLFGPGRFGCMRTPQSRRWSSFRLCGRAIRTSGRRGHHVGGRSLCRVPGAPPRPGD